MNSKLTLISHEADICVVGGGIGGMFSAISAARNGAKVVLMQDRPVLGGNASSEIRMWISGAGTRVRDLQETGLLEELLLDNMYRNPKRNFSVWDSLLYEKVRFEPNIELLLNCSCCDAEMAGSRIVSVTGFQLTTYQWHQVRAKIFIDCSGDSILAPLSGAEFRMGRESKAEFNEEFGLEEADSHTMGMSILLQARETDHPVSYTPPAWAYTFKTDEEMNFKPHDLYQINTNFYWIELGGMEDSIGDTEKVRDELLKIAFGVWDHMKNQGDHGAENWELEWVGFLPGKRESRRYVGDYVLNQNDVENHPVFPDTVAYGGWQIDNHLPGGFHMGGHTGSHLQKRRLSEPYGIPYRCLYSKNIENLMFAGRNISTTHLGLSTSRVMGTVGVLGQAAGTAAAIAVRNGLTPREAGQQRIGEIQAQLMEDDCFLPGFRRQIPEVSKKRRPYLRLRGLLRLAQWPGPPHLGQRQRILWQDQQRHHLYLPAAHPPAPVPAGGGQRPEPGIRGGQPRRTQHLLRAVLPPQLQRHHLRLSPMPAQVLPRGGPGRRGAMANRIRDPRKPPAAGAPGHRRDHHGHPPHPPVNISKRKEMHGLRQLHRAHFRL